MSGECHQPNLESWTLPFTCMQSKPFYRMALAMDAHKCPTAAYALMEMAAEKAVVSSSSGSWRDAGKEQEQEFKSTLRGLVEQRLRRRGCPGSSARGWGLGWEAFRRF